MSEKCVAWFHEHDRKDYASNADYMNAFMSYVARGKVGEQRPNATTQTYVLAHYNERVAELIKEEFAEWRRIMEQCLKRHEYVHSDGFFINDKGHFVSFAVYNSESL